MELFIYKKYVSRRTTRYSCVNGFRFLIFAIVILFSVDNTGANAAPSEKLTRILLEGTEATYAGDYDRAWEIFDGISDLDANHPSRQFYLASVLFWKINVDPNNPVYDDQIIRLLTQCIGRCETLLSQRSGDIEILHYLGLAWTYYGRLDVHRGRMYAGGVKGETGRDYLEEAMGLCSITPVDDSEMSACLNSDFCEDLYFPLGAYSYFAGRLPAFLKALNFLWFLPRGTTEEGLAYLRRSANHSRLHDVSAKLLLASIHMLFEKEDLYEAYEISDAVIKRFPNNPYLDLQHADILIATGQYDSAVTHAETILSKVKSGRLPFYETGVELQAGLVIAEAMLYKNEPEKAKILLEQLRVRTDCQHHTYTSKIYLLLGMMKDMRNKREEALNLYDITLDFDHRRLGRTVMKKARYFKKYPFTVTTEP